MKLGIWVDAGSRVRSLDEQLRRHYRLVEQAEEQGYDSVWVGESHSFGMPAPFQWLAALAPHTGMRLGTGVLLLPTWHPQRLAAEVATLDALSGGRFELGVGVGRAPLQRRYGVDPATVAVLADETLEMLRTLWRGEERYDGSLVHVSGPVDPKPVQDGGPPIWVGGAIRRSIDRAARFGDGWYASTTYLAAKVREQAERYRSQLASSGPAGKPRIAANRLVVVADTDERADALAARYLGPVLRRYANNGSLGDEWRTDPADPRDTYRRLARELCVIGSPESASAQLREYVDMGVTHFHARLIPDEMPDEVAMRSLEGLRVAAEGLAGSEAGP